MKFLVCALKVVLKHAKMPVRVCFWAALLPVSSVFAKLGFLGKPFKSCSKTQKFLHFSTFLQKSELFLSQEDI